MTLPHLRQYIELAGLLGAIYVVQNFDARLHDHLGRTRHRQPALLHLPDLLHGPGLRPRLRRRGRGRHRNHHHRDRRAADRVQPVQGGEPMSTTTRHSGPRLERHPGRPAGRSQRPPTRSPHGPHMLLAVLAWVVGLLFVLPVLWMVLTSFHSETDAATNPPERLRAAESRGLPDVLRAPDPWPPLLNSLTAARRCRRRWCWCWPSPLPTRCRSGPSRWTDVAVLLPLAPRCCPWWPASSPSTCSPRRPTCSTTSGGSSCSTPR